MNCSPPFSASIIGGPFQCIYVNMVYIYVYVYIYIYIFDTYPPLISHQKLQKRVLLLLSPQFTAMTHQFSSPATIKVMSSIFIQ